MVRTKKQTDRRAPLFLKLITPIFVPKHEKLSHQGTRPVFILSSGRTGTTFLANFFNEFDDVTAVHEPKPSRILRMWSSAYLRGLVSDDYMSAVLYKKRKKSLRDVHTKLYIESNPYIVGFVDVLDEVFDDPLVIHIVRDPREHITSALNHGNTKGFKNILNKFMPFWHYTPPGKQQWQLPNYYRAAGNWKVKNDKLSEYGKTHMNYHLFKFEDLFDDNGREFKKLLKLLDLPASYATKIRKTKVSKNKSKDRSIQNWQHWPNQTRKDVKDILSDTIETYGYGDEDQWRNSVSM